MSKCRVIERQVEVDLFDLLHEHDFQQVKAELDKLEATVKYSRGENAKFLVKYGYETVDVNLVIDRDETDQEYAARLEAEEKRLKLTQELAEKRRAKALATLTKTEEDERALYEQLRKKFEQ